MDLTSELETNENETPTDNAMDVDNTKSLMTWQGNSTHCKLKTSLSLPPEILFLILPRAIPPYNLLDTTLSPGGQSPWCQTLHLMQSIVLVCRSWYDVGVIFLYENICIRRCHQLESLRWTLTSSAAKHLRTVVKSLTIQCYIPKSRGADIGTDLKIIMECCTSLSTFSYHARFVPPAGVMSICFPVHITHLRLEGDFDYDQLFLILIQLKDTLLSLHLIIWDRQRDRKFETSVRNHWCQLHLPSLQFLSLAFLDHFEVLDLLRGLLNMPALQRLTLAPYDDYLCTGSNLHQMLGAISLFLEVHGGQLQQLHLSDYIFAPEAFIQILASCPQLERIILHPSTFLRGRWTDSHEFFHPNLKWIDLKHYLRDKDVYRSSELHLSKKNLPALESVRRFCNFSGQSHNWLDECRPNTGAEAEEFVIDVFQHQLDCRERMFVWRFERDVLENNEGGNLSGSFTVWEDDNSGSDSDYRPTDSDSSSSEDSDDDSEDSDSEWETITGSSAEQLEII